MSIQSEIGRLSAAKTDIAAAIAAKGVIVPDGTGLDGMAALIGQISSGGGSGILMASGERSYIGGSALVSGIAFTPVMVIGCFDISYTALGNTYKNTIWGAAANTSLFTYNSTQYHNFTFFGNELYAQKGSSADATFTSEGFSWKLAKSQIMTYSVSTLRWWAFGGFEVTI